MHGSLPLSFCACMFDCVFSTMIYAVLLATSLTPSLTIILPLSGKIHSKISGNWFFSDLSLFKGRIAWGHCGELFWLCILDFFFFLWLLLKFIALKFRGWKRYFMAYRRGGWIQDLCREAGNLQHCQHDETCQNTHTHTHIHTHQHLIF